jgi:hypothetical protein
MASSYYFDMLSSSTCSFASVFDGTENRTQKDNFMTAVYIILLLLAILLPIKLYSMILKDNMKEDTHKKCPFCEQSVLKELVVCNHCGHNFVKRTRLRTLALSETLSDQEKNMMCFDVTQTTTASKDITQ